MEASMSRKELPDGPQPPLLDLRTCLVITVAGGAGAAAAHSQSWASAITSGLATLVVLQATVGRWR